jgi:hypothetical protein
MIMGDTLAYSRPGIEPHLFTGQDERVLRMGFEYFDRIVCPSLYHLISHSSRPHTMGSLLLTCLSGTVVPKVLAYQTHNNDNKCIVEIRINPVRPGHNACAILVRFSI